MGHGAWGIGHGADTVGELVGILTHQPQSILISLISVRFNAL
ncbi:hypothetical protein GXM_05748 [Nostoc sphaeroides CCNUC1]|uniref:Uncharacterized protein n=1 Tax=Nostoc sphaeroides CCNUC1 TaxID=2653204 RepID=A0A5P8W7N7_9NOSO|nr:hypothetical protein GXM_05748 [Nostoc sphaeroides CCNUC1]